jgi:hypothetical protein
VKPPANRQRIDAARIDESLAIVDEIDLYDEHDPRQGDCDCCADIPTWTRFYTRRHDQPLAAPIGQRLLN